MKQHVYLAISMRCSHARLSASATNQSNQNKRLHQTPTQLLPDRSLRTIPLCINNSYIKTTHHTIHLSSPLFNYDKINK